MAQAVFDEHPLEQYLRESGEAPELMPGSSPELMVELKGADSDMDHDPDSDEDELQSAFVDNIMSAISSIIDIYCSRHSDFQFAERFKYDVISSSLLATSLPTSNSYRTLRRIVPGNLSVEQSRASSVEPADGLHYPPLSLPMASHYWISSIAFVLFMLLFKARYYLLALVCLPGPLCSLYILSTGTHLKHDMTPCLDSLKDLKAASDAWDSVVQEAMTVLEKDESMLYGSVKSSSPPSALRVALQSSLNTTQSQCDNIRQLLIALASPLELPQLSEMYAPPSPTPSKHFSLPHSLELRPRSLPNAPRQRTISSPSPVDKRATWNGFYSDLASAGSPSLRILSHREKRRSDLSALLGTTPTPSFSGSNSAPTTPGVASFNSLGGVREEDENEDTRPNSISLNENNEFEHFGFAALDLHRRHRSSGLEAFGLRPRSPLSQSLNGDHPPPARPVSQNLSPPRTPRSPASTVSSASRFTYPHTPRHPLSLSAVTHSIDAALAARRYACSHLLALRFQEETDDSYWEDVRLVMGLLTTAFADASSRLADALDDAEGMRLKLENPSPESLSHSRSSSVQETAEVLPSLTRKARTMKEMVSFAPIPSHLSRFAAHVDAIASALNDAREHLEECVTSLKQEHDRPLATVEEREHPALQAYERLRRELGIALRECERGRERLLDITCPPTPPDSDNEDLPVLVPDTSDDSDKPDSSSPLDEELMDQLQPDVAVVSGDGDDTGDDATSHLLLTASSRHLPPQGIEQVFESDSGPGVVFARERSKLTREERIRMVKKARESGKMGLSFSGPLDEQNEEMVDRRSSLGSGGPSGGPSVEVVQELKDVIWKVGEKRRKMASGG